MFQKSCEKTKFQRSYFEEVASFFFNKTFLYEKRFSFSFSLVQLFHDGGSYHTSTSMDWFLYDRDLRHERMKAVDQILGKLSSNTS